MSRTESQEEAIRDAVRDLLAINPIMGANKIARALSDKYNAPINPKYIYKIMKKVSRQVVEENSRTKAMVQATRIAEHLRMVNDQLNKIIFAEKGAASNNAKIYAASQLAFNLEKAFGILRAARAFESPEAETIIVELSESAKQFIENAPKWDMLMIPNKNLNTETKVEAPIMLDAEVVELPNGEIIDTNKPTEPKIFSAGAVDVTKPKQPVVVRADAAERLAALTQVNNGPK